MGIAIIGSSLVLAALLFGGLILSSKLIAKKSASTGSGGELKSIDGSINSVDQSLEKALAYTVALVPLSELSELIKKKEDFEDNLTNERTKLELIEAKLNEIQKKVNLEEQNHSNLKKGREEAIDLANSIQEKKAQLAAEEKRLSEELNSSKTQLDVLSSETKLTPEQEIGLNLIKTTLKSSLDQLTSLGQTYKQSSTRFATLHGQYSDLESEFTKLVEKDLSGEGDDDEEE